MLLQSIHKLNAFPTEIKIKDMILLPPMQKQKFKEIRKGDEIAYL